MNIGNKTERKRRSREWQTFPGECGPLNRVTEDLPSISLNFRWVWPSGNGPPALNGLAHNLLKWSHGSAFGQRSLNLLDSICF